MKALRIIDCEQGTPEWHKARAGIPTASMFGVITKRLKNGNYSDTRRTYMLQLAGERITEEIAETYDGGPLARGKAMEDDARKLYEFFNPDTELQRVGFAINDDWRAGASPDSLIGIDGGLEIKTKKAGLHIDVLLEAEEALRAGKTNYLPEDHIAQVQGGMGITGRMWWDFVSYWPKMKPYIVRIPRDEKVIASLKVEILQFNKELDAIVEKLK